MGIDLHNGQIAGETLEKWTNDLQSIGGKMKPASKARSMIRKAEKLNGACADGSIDIREIAKTAGFKIINMENGKDESFSGVYVFKKGVKVIFVNPDVPTYVQNIVIATLMARATLNITCFEFIRRTDVEVKMREGLFCDIFEEENG